MINNGQVNAAPLVVRDQKTGTDYPLELSDYAVQLRMPDGQRVRVYPLVVQSMVRVGTNFHGKGTMADRLMKRVK